MAPGTVDDAVIEQVPAAVVGVEAAEPATRVAPTCECGTPEPARTRPARGAAA